MKTKIILIAVILVVLISGYFYIQSKHRKVIIKKDLQISELRQNLLALYQAKTVIDTFWIRESDKKDFFDTTFFNDTTIFYDTLKTLIYEKAPINNYKGNNSGDNYSFDYRVVVKGWMTSIAFKNIFIKKEIEKIIIEVPFEVVELKEVYMPKRHLYLVGGFYSGMNTNSWVAGFDYFGKKRAGFGIKYFFQNKGIEFNLKYKLF